MKLEEISQLDINKFLDRDTLKSVQDLSQDSMYEVEPHQAADFFDVINDIVSKNSDVLKKDQGIYDSYLTITLGLYWKGYQAIDKQLKKNYFIKYLVYSLSHDIDVLLGLRRYLALFEYNFGPDQDTRNELLSLLNVNEEQIGTSPVELKTGDRTVPQLKNWLKDFISYLPTNKSMLGNFDKVNYFTNSKNTKQLTEKDKDTLSRALDIYMFLRSPQKMAVLESRSSEFRPQQASVIPTPVKTSRPSFPPPPPPPPKIIPTPTKPMVPTPPVASTSPSNSKINFDQLISQAGAGHGQDLAVLKKQIEQSTKPVQAIPTPRPIMPQPPVIPKPTPPPPVPVAPKPPEPVAPLKPLTSVLPSPVATLPKLTAKEIKRETSTPELPAHKMAPPPPPPVAPPPPPPTPKPVVPAPQVPSYSGPKLSLGSLNDVKVMDDLKRIEVGHLRMGPMDEQLSLIKSKIIALARVNQLLPYHAVFAFEQSPLFQAYLHMGSAKMARAEIQGDLTLTEFEAVADLRKQIESL